MNRGGLEAAPVFSGSENTPMPNPEISTFGIKIFPGSHFLL